MEEKKSAVTELQTLIKAGYPLLATKTQEPIRFTLQAAQLANGRRVYQWDCLRGLQQISGVGAGGPFEDCGPFEIAARAAELPQTIIVLNNYHTWLSEPAAIQALQNNLPIYKQNATTLIFSSPGYDPPAELAREIRLFKFGLPGRDELGSILTALALAQGVTTTPEIYEQIIDNLQGLTWEEAESALAWGLVTDKCFNPLTIGAVKGQMVEGSAGLKFSTFTESLETLAGNQTLKAWALNRFARRRAGLPFRGVLILGTPGNGKSHFAKALGAAVGWRTMSLDLGRLKGGLVGATEENTEKAFNIVDAVSPCILFIDEIEKALAGATGGGAGGDGGTSTGQGAKFLTWLQDHESEVFVIATCNDIKTLAGASDGAYVRAGRWDATFFVDNPAQEVGAEILNTYLIEFTGKDLMTATGAKADKVPDLTGYSGAEIRQIAIETAYNGGDLQAARDFVIPLSKSNKEKVTALREWAAGRTIPATPPAGPAAGRAIDIGGK